MVSLDFSMLGAMTPAVRVEDVPTNETIGSVAGAMAGFLGVDAHDVALLRPDSSAVTPRTTLSSLVDNGAVHLKVVANVRVGGFDCRLHRCHHRQSFRFISTELEMVQRDPFERLTCPPSHQCSIDHRVRRLYV
jgi:hypothetical protein